MQSFGKAAESDVAGREGVDDLLDVPCIPAQPIELPDGQDVAGTQVIQAGIKLRSALPGAAHAVVCEDPDSASLMEGIKL